MQRCSASHVESSVRKNTIYFEFVVHPVRKKQSQSFSLIVFQIMDRNPIEMIFFYPNLYSFAFGLRVISPFLDLNMSQHSP